MVPLNCFDGHACPVSTDPPRVFEKLRMFGISNIRQIASSTTSRLYGWYEAFIRPLLYRFGQWLIRMTAPTQAIQAVETTGSIEVIAPEPEPLESTIPTLVVESLEPVPPLPDQTSVVEPPVANVFATCNPSDLHEECEKTVETVLDPQPVTLVAEPQCPPANDDRIVTIVAVCNVLEVLERQLTDVSQDVESSVAGVCKGFQGMATRAQAAVNAASESLGSGVKDDIGKDLISEMQKVLTSLIENVRASSDFTQTVSGKLLGLETRLAAIEDTLGAVEALANKAKLVALNGQIEAARLGPAGQAFAVVAKETKTLSTHAAQTSDSIRNLVGELSQEVKVTSAEIRKRTEVDLRRFAESESQATQMLNDIDVSHKRIMQSLNTTSQISGELRGDISKAVMSMQFQDRVSQCIAHVVETMEVLVDHVDPKSIGDCELAAKDRSDEWLSQISKRYTMDSERVALGGAELVDSSGAGAADEFDVELF